MQHRDILFPEKYDVLIHAGDALGHGTLEELKDFADWFNLQKGLKILIGGNHCGVMEKLGSEAVNEYFPEAVYLQDQGFTLPNGMLIYGSPYTLAFNNWFFQLDPEDAKAHWAKIPNNVDILVTHGPAFDHLDYVAGVGSLGDKELLKRIEEVKPSYHVFGHLHRDKGQRRIISDNNITYINAGLLDNNYRMIHEPIYFEV